MTPRLDLFLLDRRADGEISDDKDTHHHGLGGWAIFIIVVVVLVALATAAWFAWYYIRKRSGASSRGFPAPAPGGVVGWVNDKVRQFKNRRYAAGNYEGTGLAGGVAGAGAVGAGGRGRRGLDPDEAWDTRVGNEADVYGPGGYYEEQELGLQPPTAYTGTGYGVSPSAGLSIEHPPGGGERDRSKSRQRELDNRYDEEMGRGRATNPFGDDNAASMRGVSPRPIDTHAHELSGDPAAHSPTERRSMFRENV